MSKSTTPMKDPPERCTNCNSPRVGIQEGRIYFKCGTTFRGDNYEDLNNWTFTNRCNLIEEEK